MNKDQRLDRLLRNIGQEDVHLPDGLVTQTTNLLSSKNPDGTKSLSWIKLLFTYVLSILLILTLGLLAYRHTVPTTVDVHTVLILKYDTIEMLEEASDLVVMVRVSGKARQESWIGASGSKHYTTYTQVHVNQVFKGDVLAGDIIEIAEPIGYERRPWGLYYIPRDGYVPVQNDSTYLLFLSDHNGSLFITGSQQGKFVWPPPNTFTAETLEITWVEGHYMDLYGAVMNQYSDLE